MPRITPRWAFFALTLLLLGCSRSEPAPTVDFSKPPPPAAGSAAVGEDAFEGTAALLPRSAEVPGWKLKERPERYSPEKLFEAINGGADRFLAYGFEELARATYAPDGIPYPEESVIEVYQMSTPLAAFGVYSLEATSCDPPEQAPGPGCSRRSDRVAYQGSVFLKLTTYADSPAGRQELARLAQAVLKKVRGEAAVPAAFGRFPAELGAPISHQAYLAETVQHDLPGFGAAYRADYDTDATHLSLYLRALPDPAIAATTFAAAQKAMVIDAGSPGQPLVGVGDEGVVVPTEDGVSFLFRQGTDLAGGAGLKDAAAALAAARTLAASIAKVPAPPDDAPPSETAAPAEPGTAAPPGSAAPAAAPAAVPAPAMPQPATMPQQPAATPPPAAPAAPAAPPAAPQP